MEDIKYSPDLHDSSPSAPKKRKLGTKKFKNSDSDQLALCPHCNFMNNSNSQECDRCGTKFPKEVHFVPNVFLQQTFVPKTIEIKVEDKQKPTEYSSISSTSTSATFTSPVESTQEQESCEIPSNPVKPLQKPPPGFQNNKTTFIEKRTRKIALLSRSSSRDSKADFLVRLAAGKRGRVCVKCQKSAKNTIVEETLINGHLKVLHLLQIQPDSLLNAPFNDPTYPVGVEKLIFDSDCPLKTFPDFLNHFQDVHSILVGSDFFFNSKEDLKNEDDHFSSPPLQWKNIKSLIVIPEIGEIPKFKDLQEDKKSQVITRSLFILKLATVGLPCLSHCDISFPFTPKIAEAIDTLINTKFRSKGHNQALDFNENKISFVVGIKPEISLNSNKESPVLTSKEHQGSELSDSDVEITDEIPIKAEKPFEEILVTSDFEEEDEQFHLRNEIEKIPLPTSSTEQTSVVEDSMSEPLCSQNPQLCSQIPELISYNPPLIPHPPQIFYNSPNYSYHPSLFFQNSPNCSFVSTLNPSLGELTNKNNSHCLQTKYHGTVEQSCQLQSEEQSPLTPSEKFYSKSKCQMSQEKTIFEETFINSRLKVLHLLQIQPDWLLYFPFNDPTYSEGVEKLIFDSECPLSSIPDFLDRFRDVHSIQVNSNFLVNSKYNFRKEDIQFSPLPFQWTNIQSLVVIPEIWKLDCLQGDGKSQAIFKLLFILQLAITGFPSLSHCEFTVPHTPEVAAAVDYFLSTKFPSKGRKIIDYSTNEINFTVGTKPSLSPNLCNEGLTLRSSIDGTGINIHKVTTKPQNLEIPMSSHSEEEQFSYFQNARKLSSSPPICSTGVFPAMNPSSKTHPSIDHSSNLVKEESTIIKRRHPSQEKSPVNGSSQFHYFECEGVRVGDYKWSPSFQEQDESSSSKVTLAISKLGLYFSLPHSIDRHKMTRIGIPHEVVLSIKVFFGLFQSVIFILTTADFAKGVRSVLGLPDNICSTKYYCPSTGEQCQKLIVFASAERNPGAELFLETVFETTYEELDYEEAEELQTQIKCHGHK